MIGKILTIKLIIGDEINNDATQQKIADSLSKILKAIT